MSEHDKIIQRRNLRAYQKMMERSERQQTNKASVKITSMGSVVRGLLAGDTFNFTPEHIITYDLPSIPKQKAPDLSERVEALTNEVNVLRNRLEKLEGKKTPDYANVEWRALMLDIEQMAHSISYITSVYCKQRQGYSCDLIFVHNNENSVEATETILERTNDLDDRNPDFSFEYFVLHEAEIAQHDKESSILLFSR